MRAWLWRAYRLGRLKVILSLPAMMELSPVAVMALDDWLAEVEDAKVESGEWSRGGGG